ncbi:MAG: 2-dehydropantoate 2-reductase N-terminal domain-containing protein [Paracoccaceae bacterium]
MIAIVGAGILGCYLGARLSAGGAEVVLIGRERMAAHVTRHGLVATDYAGSRITAPRARFSTDPAAVAGASLVIVLVKSADTEQAGRHIAPYLSPDATILSLQNGVSNDETLARVLGRRVLAGVVGFYVTPGADGAFHQGMRGTLDLPHESTLDVLARAGLPLAYHQDMRAVQWAKLMLNLNNAINALSGLPLREELLDRDFGDASRWPRPQLPDLCCASGQAVARLTALPPRAIPVVLRLPTPLFQRIAGAMLRIDPLARSSMADDLALGRRPEVDWINGAVVDMARTMGQDAPINSRLVALVQACFVTPRPWTGAALLAELRRARNAG